VKQMSKIGSKRLLIVIGLVVVILLAACGSSSSQPTQAPPASQPTAVMTAALALDGATLLETRCSICHSADRAKQARKTQEQWDQTVTRMIGKGAKLTEAEKAALVEYLAKTYGP
jgi:cytochrome c5